MFRTSSRPTHRAPGRAVIDYRGLAAPVGRSIGGAAALGAVTAGVAVTGVGAASADAHTATAHRPSVRTSGYTPLKSTDSSVLTRGVSGTAVRTLQSSLNAQGYSLAVDGKFGPATLKAVKAFQRSAGITVDGRAGKATMAALGKDPAKKSTTKASSAKTTAKKKAAAKATARSTSASGAQPDLSSGARGSAVLTLQKKLNATGAKITADGVFGSATLKAVKAFQLAHGLNGKGYAGQATWKALNAATSTSSSSDSSSSSSSSSSKPKLRKGSRGDAVTDLQNLLRGKGSTIKADGVFGASTLASVKAMQSSVSLTADGVVGPATWKALAGSKGSAKVTSSSSGSSTSSSGHVDGDAIIAAARTQLGVKYVWGGSTAGRGLDCSGLTQWAYRQSGVSVPRTARQQTFAGTIIPQSQAKPGDLVAFSGRNWGHIGIYLGNNRILHASGSKGKVEQRDIWSSPHVFVSYR